MGADVEADRPKRRRAETVERLLDAARETFADVGFAAASVEDICSRGGFTRGAFYSSFRTKDELFAALWARETQREVAAAEQQLAGIERERDPIATAVERCLSAFRSDRTWVLVRTEYALHAARHPAARAALREHAEALHGQLTELIERTARRSGLRFTVPAGQLARIVLALHDGLVIQGVVGAGDAPHDRPAAEPAEPAEPAERAEPEPAEPPALEHTALMLLLRAVVSD